MSTALRDLWPDDIKSEEVISPEDILKLQASRLEERTNGQLTGHVVKVVGEDRVVIGFEVESPRTGSRVRLFEVQHRPEFEFPVAIIPPDETMPEFLKERVFRPRLPPPVTVVAGQWIGNEWVTSSPTEFSQKIQAVLARPSVKAIVLSLLARRPKEQAANGDEDHKSE